MLPTFKAPLFVGILVTFLIYGIVKRRLLSRQNANKAKELRCEDPPYQINRIPLGIDHIFRALTALKNKEFPVDALRRTQEIGAITFAQTILGNLEIFTADELNLQAILATQFSDFDLGDIRRNNAHAFLGSGIFTQDGKDWERSRALLRPQFVREQLSDLQMEERHVQVLMRHLTTSTQTSGWTNEVDLQPLFFRLTLDAATEFLLGTSVESQAASLQNPGEEDMHLAAGVADFASSFDIGTASLAKRAVFAGFSWLIWPRGFRKSISVCHKFIDTIVHRYLQENQSEKSGAAVHTSQDRYVFLQALAVSTQDPIELRSQMLNILLAGRDTTASLIGWTFLLLARHPEICQKLRDAIIKDFGTYTDCNPSTDITFSKIKACKYLQYCMNETLRLYPLVPWNFRVANKNSTLPRGGGKDGKSKVFVPRGTLVAYSPYVLHHRQDLWGSDAEEFKPERWERRKMGWDFLPFNGGPRICIGQQYGLTEASFVVLRLLQRFDRIENMDPDPVVRHNLTLTDCSGTGVKVKLHQA